MKISVFLVGSVAAASVSFWAGQETWSTQETATLLEMPVASLAEEGIILPDMVRIDIPSTDGHMRRIDVAKYEVTFGEWQICVDVGGCSHTPDRKQYTGDNHPVSGVSWLDVQQYISWYSAKTGRTYRLPLESEWRVLATDVLDEKVEKLFDDPRLAWAADYVNFGKRAERKTRPIGSFGDEASGVSDVAGNVWEWTETCKRNLDREFLTEPTDNCGGSRVLAGVHMTYQSELIRFVPTGGCSIGFPPANIGFRLVRDVEPRIARKPSAPEHQEVEQL